MFALLTVVVLMTGLAACGDDDDDETTASGSGSETEEAAGGDVEKYCDAVTRIETVPEPDIDFEALSPEQQAAEAKKFTRETIRPIVDEIVAVAPEEIAADITVLDRAVKEVEETGDFEAAFEGDPAVEKASDNAHAFDLENCGWGRTDVKGLDYSFQGIPKEIDAGIHSFEFANAGKEEHMMAIIKKKEGTTETFDQLLELPEDQAEAKTEFLGETSAGPGEDEYLIVDLTEGEYIAICFFPVGSTPEAHESGQEVDGPPHFTRGMKAEFTVA